MALSRELIPEDINRELIDDYLRYLSTLETQKNTQRSNYTKTKTVLQALGQRGIIHITHSGDTATFPRNPFPHSNRKCKSETALSQRERRAFIAALQHAIKPLWDEKPHITGKLLSYVFLVVALHTGRNLTPLLEMCRECLQPHPKENILYLSLQKRRGYNTSKIALRAMQKVDRPVEITATVKTNVADLIKRVIELTEPLVTIAPPEIKDRVWLYKIYHNKSQGVITSIKPSMLSAVTAMLVAEYGLTNAIGEPLSINVSRLRKTFGNRIFELTDGNLMITAAALGNSPQVTDKHYLAPGEFARRNWQFMGEMLVQELISKTIGSTYKDTPIGHCSDPISGQYAPKRNGEICMNFMNCLRCQHYAVTADDLYKIFSFYFRVLAERSRMNKNLWSKNYSKIPRLIDHYIVAEGIRRGIFKPTAVEEARKLARTSPHPFWSFDLIETLEAIA